MEGLHTEVSDKSSQLDQLKAELNEKTTGLSNLKQEIVMLQEQLDSSNQTVRKLEVQQQTSTMLINEQKTSLAAANEERLQLEKVVCEYKEKAERLIAENNELEKSMEMLNARHQDAILQLIASRDDLAASNKDLRLAAQCETSGQLDMDSSGIDNSKPKPLEVSLSDRSSLLSESAEDSSSDARNVVKEEKHAQVECDLVLSLSLIHISEPTRPY